MDCIWAGDRGSCSIASRGVQYNIGNAKRAAYNRPAEDNCAAVSAVRTAILLKPGAWTDGPCQASFGSLDRVQAGLSGSDSNGFLDVGDEDLAVADAAGLGGAEDRLDRAFDQIVADNNLDLHLRQEIDDVFGAAIELGMAFLATEALGLGHGDALKSHFLKRFLH